VRKTRILPLGVAAALTAALAVSAVVGSGLAAPAKPSATTFRAGLVSDVGRFNDKGFNQNQLTGLNLAKKKLKITTRAIESRQASDYIPNFTTLARANYNVTVGAGFLLADAEDTVAGAFPRLKYGITDYDVTGAPFNGSQSPNVMGSQFAVEENSYLIGCLAGLVAKRAGGQQLISVVGGVKIPPVDAFLAGYRAGARKCNKGIQVRFDYSGSFIDQAACKEKALNQIADGTKVVFAVAGPCGLGALDAAKERGRWGVGVDVDQSYLGRHILTNAIKRVDLWVYRVINLVKTGKFRGGTNMNFNLKNGGVKMGWKKTKTGINPRARAPKAWVTRLAALKKQIINNKINPPTSVG
jgi:basic membrane protein A